MLRILLQQIKNKHFLSFTSSIFSSGCSMLSFFLLLRSLKLEEMGYWIFFQTAIGLLDTFRSGFLQTALIKFYAGATKVRAAEVIGSVWFIGLLITVFWLILTIPVFFLLPFIDDISIKIVLQWFAIVFLLTLPSTISNWRQQSDQKFDRLLLIAIISQGTFITSIVILILTDQMNITNLLYANAVASLLTSSICLLSGWSGVKFLSSKTKACILQIYHFGKFSVGTSISSNLLKSSDIFMINFLLGPSLVPIYNVAQRLMEIVEIPLRSIFNTALPELSTAFNKNRIPVLITIMNRYAGALTFALFPVAIAAIFLADIAVAFLGGGKYIDTEAANVFRIFMLLSVLYPLDRFTGVTLDVIHQPKRNLVKVLIILVVNVVANYIGIVWFESLYAVAAGTVLSFIIGFVYSYSSLQLFLSFNLKGIFKEGKLEWKSIYIKFMKPKIS